MQKHTNSWSSLLRNTTTMLQNNIIKQYCLDFWQGIMETNIFEAWISCKKTKQNKKRHLHFKAAGEFFGFADTAAGGRANLGLCRNSAAIQSETLIWGLVIWLHHHPGFVWKRLLFHTFVFSAVVQSWEPPRPPQLTPTPHWSRRVAFHNDNGGKTTRAQKSVRSGVLLPGHLTKHVQGSPKLCKKTIILILSRCSAPVWDHWHAGGCFPSIFWSVCHCCCRGDTILSNSVITSTTRKRQKL